MSNNEEIVLRMNIVAGMDTYIRDVIGDDEVTESWLMYGMPDGSDEDSLYEDMQNEQTFEDWVVAFRHCLHLAKNS